MNVSSGVSDRTVSGDLQSTGRVRSLDGVRGISVLLVLLAHIHVSGHPLPQAAAIGNIGVRLFFVLSGFLITSLLQNEEAAKGSVSLKHFYIRRAFRILPACWCYVLAVGIMTAIHLCVISPVALWTSMTYVSNYVRWDLIEQPLRHLWSLSVEEQFYLIWPFLFVYLPKYRRKMIVVVLVASPLWRMAIVAHPAWHIGETIDRRLDAIADCIAAGCFIALRPPAVSFLRPMRAGLSLALLFIGIAGGFTLMHPRFYYGAGETLLNCGLAIFVAAAVRFRMRTSFRWLESSPLVVMGTLSYSLYLWQQIVLVREGGASPPLWSQLCLCGVLAVLSFFFIEKPALRLRSALLNGDFPRSRAAVAGAPVYLLSESAIQASR
jgi:peptidoglycan/LPS O-acetylase OafA/YrhL